MIAAGDPFHNESMHISLRTPTGLTESELLAAFNYLDQDALLSFEGIGPTLAANIIAHRTKSQYFASLDEIAQVPRIGAKRFAKLTGRPPQTGRFRLHDLMRRSRREDLRLADLQPWSNPSPGIASIHVLPSQSPRPEHAPDQQPVVIRLRRYAIHFLCTEPPSGGRAHFLLKNLPEVLRPLLS